jgi:glycine/D-amino acid oxidase-like deaminating enzyme
MKKLKSPRVAIVGAGVIGLTTASVLSESCEVTVFADRIGTETESIKATAIWHVYLVPETKKVLSWAKSTLEKLVELESKYPESGVESIRGYELFREGEKTLPSWRKIPNYFRLLELNEIDSFNSFDLSHLDTELQVMINNKPIKWGYEIEAPVVSMDNYLNWLYNKVITDSVKVIKKRIVSLQSLCEDFDFVVNCTSLGARELISDTNFNVYKGEYFVVPANGIALTHYVGDDDFPTGMSYIIPRFGELLIGGCAYSGEENYHSQLDWKETYTRATIYTPQLISMADDFQPRRVIGLRPYRTGGVRLELDSKQGIGSGKIIHNYGHGGSGFSLSWGCAEEVLALIMNRDF